MNEGRKTPAERACEIYGIVLIALSVLCLLAVASWSRHDPSLNNATTIAPHNWLGIPGAYVSDVLLQTIGLGVLPMLFILSQWGVGFLRHARPTWIFLARILA